MNSAASISGGGLKGRTMDLGHIPSDFGLGYVHRWKICKDGMVEVYCGLPGAAEKLLGYLRWPEDDAKRNAFQAAWGQFVLAHADEHERQLRKEFPSHFRWLDTFPLPPLAYLTASIFDRYGGHKTIAYNGSFSTLFSELRKPTEEDRIAIAGLVLLLIYALQNSVDDRYRGKSSINMSMYLICHQLGLKKRRVEEAWWQYKNVSHISAALIYFWETYKYNHFCPDRLREYGSICFPIVYQTAEVLCVARQFEEFGLSYRPRARNDSTLSREYTWRVPLPLSKAGAPDIREIPRGMRELIENYRSDWTDPPR